MGLSNSIRELLLENIERNNYVNDLKPVSKQIEFSTVEELHHKTIEESKKVKVKNNGIKSLIKFNFSRLAKYIYSLSFI